MQPRNYKMFPNKNICIKSLKTFSPLQKVYPMFSLSDKKYKIVQKLSKGGFSHVYKIKEKKTGRHFALKVFDGHTRNCDKKDAPLISDLTTKINECLILKMVSLIKGCTSVISQGNVRDYIDLRNSEKYKIKLNYPCILMKLYDATLRGFTDQEFFSEKKKLQKICSIAKQLLNIVWKVHKSGVIHMDIKPGNIMVKDDRVVLGDFGSSVSLSVLEKARTRLNDFRKRVNPTLWPFYLEKLKNSEGFVHEPKDTEYVNMKTYFFEYMTTPCFRAPERFAMGPFTKKVDVFAIGCTIYYLITARLFYEDLYSRRFPRKYDSLDMFMRVFHRFMDDVGKVNVFEDDVIPVLNTNINDKELQTLLKGMLNFDPVKRWNITKCIEYIKTRPNKTKRSPQFRREYPSLKKLNTKANKATLAKLKDDIVKESKKQRCLRLEKAKRKKAQKKISLTGKKRKNRGVERPQKKRKYSNN